jgi:hypothetical protein
MEQNPSEACSRAGSQEIPRLLWKNPKVHYRVHKSPLLNRILSQVTLVHTLVPYFCKIHFNIILQSTLRSSQFRVLRLKFWEF